MDFDFNQVITQDENSAKWSSFYPTGQGKSLLPLWVADMDFPTAPAIRQALDQRVSSGLFGYGLESKSYYQAICDWMARRHQSLIEPEWISTTPGVVTAIHLALQVFTKPQDHIVIQTPSYPPFAHAINSTGRQVLENPLTFVEDHYEIDFDHLEQLFQKAKLFILCNPHNPTGKVFTRDELAKIAALSRRYGVFIIADEIHQDLVYRGQTHTPYLNLQTEPEEKLIVTTAPSKTFNLAGLSTSNCIIPHPKTRELFQSQKLKNGLKHINVLGKVACQAAYTQGEPWLEAVLSYLEGNCDYALTALKEASPVIATYKPQGTYFLWLDCRGLGIAPEQTDKFFREEAGIHMNCGTTFGQPGFMRMNIACRRQTLTQAISQIEKAIKNH